MPAALFLFCISTLASAASPVEIDAAVARVASAVYQTRLASACGLPKSPQQLKAAEQIARVIALKKDGLDKALSNEEFVTVQLRTMDKDLLASIDARAASDAKTGACDGKELKEMWALLSGLADIYAPEQP